MEKDAIYCIFGSQNYVMAGETPHKSYSFKRFLDPLFRVYLRYTRGNSSKRRERMKRKRKKMLGGGGMEERQEQISDISRCKR